MRYWKILITFAIVLFFVGCGAQKESAQKSTYKNGDRIELTSVTGRKITLLRKNGGFVLEGDENKILILDAFGTFCAPCQKEAPELMKFQLEHEKDVLLVGFIHFEKVTNQYVIDNFSSKYNAHYFIVNSPDNDKMINTFSQDIRYNKEVQIPFKVVLKNGKYQSVTDIYEGKKDNKFYIGAVGTDVIAKDIEKIKKQ